MLMTSYSMRQLLEQTLLRHFRNHMTGFFYMNDYLIDLCVSNGIASHSYFASDRIPLAMQSSIRACASN